MASANQRVETEHVTMLTPREWVTMLALLLAIGGVLAYASLYQAFKTGQFITGGLMSVALCYPMILVVTRHAPWRAIHLTNHLQTAVSAAGSSVGMGSMLVAYQWAGGPELLWWQIMLMAVPSTLFGIYVAHFFAENLINKQKLSFPSGLAIGTMLRGMSQKGKALKMIGLGITIAIPLVAWESPVEAALLGTGWICGIEIMGWAMLTALVCRYIEPSLLEAGLIQKSYREFTLYIGASMIFSAGLVDMIFSFFSKNVKGDNPDFTERTGFLPKKLNLSIIFGITLSLTAVLKLVFGVDWLVALGSSVLIIPMVYVGLVCLGKTDLAPVSVLSGSVILFATSFVPKMQALMVGAMAGQANSNGLDAGQDLRSGERVGSHFPLQRNWQIIGGVVGSALMLTLMYTLFMKAYGADMTYENVTAGKSAFDCGFALKYYGFLSLKEKLGGFVGTACLWTMVIVAIVQTIKNMLISANKGQVARLIPSAYACSLATIVGFAPVTQQFYGAAIAAVFFLVWRTFGSSTPIAGQEQKDDTPAKCEPMLWSVPWHAMVGIAGGLLIGESFLSFISANLSLFGISGLFQSSNTKATFIIAVGLYVLKLLHAPRKRPTD